MHAEAVLRVRGDVRRHRVRAGRRVEARAAVVKEPVDRVDRADRIAHEVGVLHVDDRMLGVRGAERVDAPHRLLEHRHPVLGDVGAVVGVAERSRQRADQAAHRCAQHDRVAVQQHEAGVGVDGGQRVEVERVVRALERPAAPDAAALQHLQREAGGIRRRSAGRRPSSHSPYAGTLEIASHDRLLKSWLISVMHSVGPSGSSWWIARMRGLICSSMSLPKRAISIRGSVVQRLRRRRRNAVAGLPAQQRAVAGVLFEQVAEERRAGAEHADHDQRRVDAFVGDVGMPVATSRRPAAGSRASRRCCRGWRSRRARSAALRG